MEQDILVAEGHRLVTLLDATPAAPRGAIWVAGPGPRWRLWIIPAVGVSLSELNAIVAGALAAHSDGFPSIDTQCVVAKPADDPAVRGLGMMARVEGLNSVQFSGCSVNGVALPDCFVLRLEL